MSVEQVIDSLNFLPMKLSILPEALGFEELKKGWFPNHFNTREIKIMWDPIQRPNITVTISWVRRKDKNCWHGWMRERMTYLIFEKKC